MIDIFGLSKKDVAANKLIRKVRRKINKLCENQEFVVIDRRVAWSLVIEAQDSGVEIALN